VASSPACRRGHPFPPLPPSRGLLHPPSRRPLPDLGLCLRLRRPPPGQDIRRAARRQGISPDLGLRLRRPPPGRRAVRRQRISAAAFFIDPPSARGVSPSLLHRPPPEDLDRRSLLHRPPLGLPLSFTAVRRSLPGVERISPSSARDRISACAVRCQGQFRGSAALPEICTGRRCCGQGHGSAMSLLPPAAVQLGFRAQDPRQLVQVGLLWFVWS
jgi:hypothetical protein